MEWIEVSARTLDEARELALDRLGVVGDDEPGHRLEALLLGTGIAAHLKRDPGLRTTVKLRVIGRQQQLLRMDFENEPDHEVLALQNEAFAGQAFCSLRDCLIGYAATTFG